MKAAATAATTAAATTATTTAAAKPAKAKKNSNGLFSQKINEKSFVVKYLFRQKRFCFISKAQKLELPFKSRN